MGLYLLLSLFNGHAPAAAELIHASIAADKRDENQYCNLLLFDYNTGRLTWRRHHSSYSWSKKDWTCQKDIFSEESFLLSDPGQRRRASSELDQAGVYDETRFAQLKNLTVSPCAGIPASGLPQSVGEISAVLQKARNDQLNVQLAQNVLPLPERTSALQLRVEGVRFHVKFKFDQNGDVAWMEITDPAKIKALQALGIQLEKREQDGKAHWSLVKKGVTLVAFKIEQLDKQGNSVTGKLALYTSGKAGFDKHAYRFSLSKNKGASPKMSARQSFWSSRIDLFKNPLQKAPVSPGGALENVAFKTFFSVKGRREFVRDSIKEQLNANFEGTEFAEFLPPERIATLADEISDEVEEQTRGFSTFTGHISAVALRSTVNKIIDEVQAKALAKYFPDIDYYELEAALDVSLTSPRKCLDQAVELEDMKAAEGCIGKALAQLPAELADAVLGIKLKQMGLSGRKEYARGRLRVCLNERYFAEFVDKDNKIDEKRFKQFEKGGNAIKVVQACAYSSVFDMVDQIEQDLLVGKETIVDRELAKIGKEKNLTIKLSGQKKAQAFAKVNRCLEKKGLKKRTDYGTVLPFERLKNTSGTEFEHELTGCLDRTTQEIGGAIVDNMISEKLKSVKDISVPMKKHIRTEALEGSYKKCTDLIIDTIEKAKKTKSDVPSFDPLYCEEHIYAHTIEKAIPAVLAQQLGKERYDKMISDAKSAPKFQRCFARTKKEIEDNLPGDLTGQVDTKQRSDKYKTQIADCLKQTLSWAAKASAGPMVEEMIKKEIPDFKLSAAQKDTITKAFGQCLGKKTETLNDPDMILEKSDLFIDSCSVELIKNPAIQKIAVVPLLTKSLTEAGIEGEDLKATQGLLLAAFKGRIKNETTLDGVMKQVKTFKDDGALTTVNFIMEKELKDILGTLTKDENFQRQRIAAAQENFRRCFAKTKKVIEPLNLAINGCVVSTLKRTSMEVLDKTRDLASDFFAKNPQTDKNLAACLDAIDQSVRQAHPSLKNVQDVPSLYGKAMDLPGGKIDIDWYSKELESCFIAGSIKDIASEYGTKLSAKEQLSPDGQKVLQALVDSAKEIFSLKDESGNPIDLVSSAAPEADSQGLLDDMKEMEEVLVEQVKTLAAYDADSAAKNIHLLKAEIKDHVTKNGNKLDTDAVLELVGRSRLLDTTLQANVANQLAEQVEKNLAGQGISEARQKALSSPFMLRRNFADSRAGKKVMDRLKTEYAIPLLTGKSKAASPPPDIEGEIAAVLADDDTPDGFAETILSDLVQKKLDEQAKDLTTGSFAKFKLAAAWLLGYKVKNFHWGPPADIRKSCGGRRASRAFSRHILRPMLVSGKKFSDEELNQIVAKTIEPHVEEAIKNPEHVKTLADCKSP